MEWIRPSAVKTVAIAALVLFAPTGLIRGQSTCVDTNGFRAEEAQLRVQGGTLHGTLLVPSRTDQMPVAVLLSGSGPADRDGNTAGVPGRHDSLKLLAEALARHGIASLRYDRRGIGASREAQLSEADFRFSMLAEDAAGWVTQLRKDGRIGPVAIIGHSEGSLAGILAAQRSAVDALVTLAGPGRPHWRGLQDQLAEQLPSELRPQADSILHALADGRTHDRVPEPLQPHFRPSVQPYLISLYRLDPAVELSRLRIPVLIVQGTTDLQVPPTDADSLLRLAAEARIARIEGMNHVLKAASGPLAMQWRAYTDPSLPIMPGLVDELARFLCLGARS